MLVFCRPQYNKTLKLPSRQQYNLMDVEEAADSDPQDIRDKSVLFMDEEPPSPKEDLF